MKIILNHSSNHESNEYLRALWAKFRTVYGKCAWQFMPHKHGQSKTVHFGFMDIGLGSSFEVSINYERKGIIKSINLESSLPREQLDLVSSLCSGLSQSSHKEPFIISSVLDSQLPSFAPVVGNGYRIFHRDSGESVLEVQVLAFDHHDAVHIAACKLQNICDLLAVFTNSFVKLTQLICAKIFTEVAESKLFSGDLNWVDDHPIENELTTLASYQKSALDLLLQGKVKNQFINGAAHFNNAAFLLKDHSLAQGALTDTATVLYVSALESCAMTRDVAKESCSSCRQVKYSIRRRVLDVVGEFLPSHLVRFIDGYYASRSKFLHEGIKSSNNNYFGTSIPQLSLSSDSGCKAATTVLPINLRDYVSYIFRGIAMSEAAYNS